MGLCTFHLFKSCIFNIIICLKVTFWISVLLSFTLCLTVPNTQMCYA